jgi:hypothetical protein
MSLADAAQKAVDALHHVTNNGAVPRRPAAVTA